ncbi:MAG: GIY-YIG nuclease family protein [Bacteroidales bacterium]|nr:GIY-YIG nuclease family protein [Bacteroidales bacterium]
MYIIYKILNTFNGKKYIGMTSRNVATRFREHCRNTHRRISNAIQAYGVNNFICSEIAQTDKYSVALYLEKENIIKENALQPYGYNTLCNGTDAQFLFVKNSGRQYDLF